MENAKIIIGNKRSNRPLGREFKLIDVDRKHLILGNKYILKNRFDDKEREDVIEKYRKDFYDDCLVFGPMYKSTLEIANMVRSGESIALMCWCHGHPTYKPCHAEIIKEKIEEMLKDG